MLKFKKLIAVLPGGTNTHTFTDDLINDDSVIEVYTNDDNIYPVNINQINNTVTVTLVDHADTVGLCITVNNVVTYKELTAGTNITISDDGVISATNVGDINLSELKDISFNGLDGGQVLMYNHTTSKWVNAFIDSSHVADINYTNLKNATDKIKSIDLEIEGINDDISDINEDITGITSVVNTLADDLQDAEGDIDDLKQDLHNSEWELISANVSYSTIVDISSYSEIMVIGCNSSYSYFATGIFLRYFVMAGRYIDINGDQSLRIECVNNTSVRVCNFKFNNASFLESGHFYYYGKKAQVRE